MIKEFERFHGLVFSRIIHAAFRPISFKNYPTSSNASYILNDDTGIYIKYSTKRMSPWRFSFLREHQGEIENMKKNLGEVFLVLVCNDDGIVCLNYSELNEILDENHEDVEWISVGRKPRQMYSVAGSNGKLNFKIGDSDFPNKLFQANNSPKKGVINWFAETFGS